MARNQNEVIVIPDDDNKNNNNHNDGEANRQSMEVIGAATACRDQILNILPDICPNHLETLMLKYGYDSQAVVAFVFDQADSGTLYPQRQKPSLKRKRGSEDDNKDAEKVAKTADDFNRPGRVVSSVDYVDKARELLRTAFPTTHAQDITNALKKNRNQLYSTYLLLSGEVGRAMRQKKTKTPHRQAFDHGHIDATIASEPNPDRKEALREFKAAQLAVETQSAEAESEQQRAREELANLTQAQEEGAVGECGCCFDEFALNRMVHCNTDNTHWFCGGCARRMAEGQVGLSRSELGCMSMDGCTGGFSRDQREMFLDEKMRNALERIEQEAALRLAGIENLETCPFCPFAAEYPPMEEDKEFRCQNPGCEVVSCRLCREETHIPKTCEEAKYADGHSARRQIEEAMSAAMIRKCNKCGSPFIKELGCNKMRCTRDGCGNIQCYVCGKSCRDYDHFNEVKRGGMPGNCPLWDNLEERHEDEVRRAEEEARKQVLKDNPGVDAEVFKIKVSDKVKEDEERRKKTQAVANPPGLPPYYAIGGRLVRDQVRLEREVVELNRLAHNLAQARVLPMGAAVAPPDLRLRRDANLANNIDPYMGMPWGLDPVQAQEPAPAPPGLGLRDEFEVRWGQNAACLGQHPVQQQQAGPLQVPGVRAQRALPLLRVQGEQPDLWEQLEAQVYWDPFGFLAQGPAQANHQADFADYMDQARLQAQPHNQAEQERLQRQAAQEEQQRQQRRAEEQQRQRQEAEQEQLQRRFRQAVLEEQQRRAGEQRQAKFLAEIQQRLQQGRPVAQLPQRQVQPIGQQHGQPPLQLPALPVQASREQQQQQQQQPHQRVQAPIKRVAIPQFGPPVAFNDPNFTATFGSRLGQRRSGSLGNRPVDGAADRAKNSPVRAGGNPHVFMGGAHAMGAGNNNVLPIHPAPLVRGGDGVRAAAPARSNRASRFFRGV